MDKLDSELQRLHLLPLSGGQALGMRFLRTTDWPAIAMLCQAMQDELDLPPPVVSIDGQGYQLWLPLAEAVDNETAARFLNGLQHRYLPELPNSRLHFGIPAELPPYQLAGSERWAAFIDPGMGSLFTGEPWLDMPLNRNQQADLLAAGQPIGRADFRCALALLQPLAKQTVDNDADQTTKSASLLSLQNNFTDPRQFLLAVMNDPQASVEQRIDAAKALLPYFEKARQDDR